MVTTITGTTNKPVSSDRLKNYFSAHNEFDGILYIGYPIIGTVEGAYPIDALWISPKQGLVVFNLIEGKRLGDYQDDQDDSYNKVESRLKGHRELVYKRQLQVSINVITFAPAIVTLPENDDYPVCNENTITNQICDLNWEHPEYYEKLVSVLQSVSMIRKGRKKREVKHSESRGANSRGRSKNSRTSWLWKNNCVSLKSSLSPRTASGMEDCCDLQYTLTEGAAKAID